MSFRGRVWVVILVYLVLNWLVFAWLVSVVLPYLWSVLAALQGVPG